MAENPWTESDTARARRFWAEYQRQHDISTQIGQTAGIDPVSGRIWFGTSAKDILAQPQQKIFWHKWKSKGCILPSILSGSVPTITSAKDDLGDGRNGDG